MSEKLEAVCQLAAMFGMNILEPIEGLDTTKKNHSVILHPDAGSRRCKR